MGYKYRNGSTPDHVDSSSSDSSATDDHGLGGPGPKKAAPVDTVALKKRISASSAANDKIQDAMGDYFNSNPKTKEKVGDGGTYDTMLSAASKIGTQLDAQEDSLSKARKGKIPAK